MDLDLLQRTVDPMVAGHVAAEPIPALVFGVVADGTLVHSGAFGTLRLGTDRRPGVDSTFRIASMTKSFTAATVLSLRDDGLLRLDDPVVEHVPQLRGPAGDRRVTLRHLLTMTSGLPTDDPWGDRKQQWPAADFDTFLAEEPWLAWRPGEAYEYSNLGYALLGRAVEAVTGQAFGDVVRQRLLDPLGLADTVFHADQVPPERLVTGYVRRDDQWVEEPPAGYGAFAPMGGLFSSVGDLARWVSWLLDAESTDADGGGAADVLHPASRREMQRASRLVDADVGYPDPDGDGELRVRGYGFGLVEEYFPEGRTVGHSGGYPGFGSHMRWHPASGLGVVALGSRTYAPMTRLATDVLRAAVRAATPRAVGRRSAPAARVDAARAAVLRLLEEWDDDVVRTWFADNVDLDDPVERRRDWFAEVRRRHGRLRPSDAHPEPGPRTPSQDSRWFDGEQGGRVRIDLLLSPDHRPRLQWVAVTSVPEPSAPLRAAAAAEVARRSAQPRWAGARLGPPTAGDGRTSATFGVLGARLAAEVVVTVPDGDATPPTTSWRVLPVRADIR